MLLKINSKYIKKCAQLLINVLIQPNELKEYSFRTAWGTCRKSQIWETKTEWSLVKEEPASSHTSAFLSPVTGRGKFKWVPKKAWGAARSTFYKSPQPPHFGAEQCVFLSCIPAQTLGVGRRTRRGGKQVKDMSHLNFGPDLFIPNSCCLNLRGFTVYYCLVLQVWVLLFLKEVIKKTTY